jgi:hypothetical protein
MFSILARWLSAGEKIKTEKPEPMSLESSSFRYVKFPKKDLPGSHQNFIWFRHPSPHYREIYP